MEWPIPPLSLPPSSPVARSRARARGLSLSLSRAALCGCSRARRFSYSSFFPHTSFGFHLLVPALARSLLPRLARLPSPLAGSYIYLSRVPLPRSHSREGLLRDAGSSICTREREGRANVRSIPYSFVSERAETRGSYARERSVTRAHADV